MIKVVLFGNTGLANGVFRALAENDSIEICAVYTRKLPGHFPYYDEDELWQLSEGKNIPTFTGQNVNSQVAIDNISKIAPDYIIVSSFDQILKEDVMRLAKLRVINFHPSLLPKYRGPNPISWVLINGENKTGLSIHDLTQKIDSGNILYQQSLEIQSNDNLGSLYQKLSALAANMSLELVNDIASGQLCEGKVQREEISSYYAKSSTFRYIDTNESLENILNRFRAFSPFPKPMIKFEGNEYFIDSLNVNNRVINSEDAFNEAEGKLFIKKEDCILEFNVSRIF